MVDEIDQPDVMARFHTVLTRRNQHFGRRRRSVVLVVVGRG